MSHGHGGRRESHQFSRVPQVRAQRSEFDRSHGLKTTMMAGELTPIYAEEVVPGDTHKLDASLFGRLATLLKPIMDNVYLETFFFFVPARLVWNNWQRMWGEQDNPTDSTDFLVPIVDMDAAGAAEGGFFDYLGIPTGVPDLQVNALYSRASNLIWNQWFRDENLQDSLVVDKDDGPDDIADYEPLRRRGKRHDYFTSSLPNPQKGPSVSVPLGSLAPVIPDVSDLPNNSDAPQFKFSNITQAALFNTAGATGQPANFGHLVPVAPSAGQTIVKWAGAGITGLVTDLAGATAASINDFRQAVVIQQYYEMLARGGSRYTELLRGVYGVSNGDDRLQRPEYLGGGRTPIMVNPVVNTAGESGAGGTAVQADLAAYGVASSRSGDRHGFTKSFTEHGVILGYACVRADLNYQQGLLRQFSRRSKFDYLIPHFANIGEQAVLNKEIYAQGPGVLNPSTGEPYDEEVFGYVPRYDDYRYKPSMVTGQYRSNAISSLDFWHLAQDFADLPVLSPEFIEENPPIDRVIAVPSEPHLLLDVWFKLRSVRELPLYSVPGLTRI